MSEPTSNIGDGREPRPELGPIQDLSGNLPSGELSAQDLTPEVITSLLSEQGIIELRVNRDCNIQAVNVLSNGDSDRLSGFVIPDGPFAHLQKMLRVNHEPMKAEQFLEMVIDPDIHTPDQEGSYAHIKPTDVVKLIRQEVLPMMIAETLKVTGKIHGRGCDGFDMRTVVEPELGSQEFEDIQIKLVPQHSSLFKVPDIGYNKRFYGLVATLRPTRERERNNAKLLLVQDGSSSKSLLELKERFTQHDIERDQILVLSEREMSLMGIELPNLRKPEGVDEYVLLRIDLHQQSRAILAEIWLNSDARKQIEELRKELRAEREEGDDPIRIAIRNPSLALLQRRGIMKLAREIEAERALWE